MKEKIKLFGLFFWLHLTLILIAYTSPFLFDWRLIVLGIFLLFLGYWIFNGCILTNKQFGEDDSLTFWTIYLEMAGLKFKRRRLKFFIRFILPVIIFSVALLWQIILQKKPVFF